ncbi:ubiquitin-like autophagy protein Apg12-domain-containing protein [Mycena amicta]|nr:ubiquitin-like autophagy protein Apg12-domain-containing protein [Mycena amicta]
MEGLDPREPDPQALQALLASKQHDDASKVIILLKAVGNAPILKQQQFTMSTTRSFQAIINALRTKLGYQAREPLFTYINNAFCPAPDENVGDLFKSFGTNGKLIVNYRLTL